MWEFQRFCFPFTLLTSNGNSYRVVFSRVILIKMIGGVMIFLLKHIRNSGYKLLGSKEWERLIQNLLKMPACIVSLKIMRRNRRGYALCCNMTLPIQCGIPSRKSLLTGNSSTFWSLFSFMNCFPLVILVIIDSVLMLPKFYCKVI